MSDATSVSGSADTPGGRGVIGYLVVFTDQPTFERLPTTPKVAWSPCYRVSGPAVRVRGSSGSAGSRRTGAARRSRSRSSAWPPRGPASGSDRCSSTPADPGGSGVDFVAVRAAAPPEGAGALRSRRLRPRGIARSTALRCFGNASQWGRRSRPFAFPLTPTRKRRVDRRRSATWWTPATSAAARIIDHMATADVARDMDRCARRSATTAHYAGVLLRLLPRRHLREPVPRPGPGRRRRRRPRPDRLVDRAPGTGGDAAVLDPAAQRRGAQATLDEFFRLCDAGGPNCAFSGDAAPVRGAREPAARAPRPDHVPGDRPSRSLQLLLPHRQHPGRDVRLVLLAGLRRIPCRHRAQASRRRSAPARALPRSRAYITKRGSRATQRSSRGFPASRAPTATTPAPIDAWSDAGNAADATSATSGGSGRGPSICAHWPAADAARYTGPFTAAPPTPCSSSATSSTRQRATRRQTVTTCCPTPAS